MYDERTHRYSYDNQHRLVHYVRTQYRQTQAEGRYLYDALGRRVGKQVWKREREHSAYEQMALSRRPYVTWYGWEGDRLVTVQTAQSRIQTVYQPGSFTPLVRIETPNAAREKARHRSLVEVLQQEGSEDGQGVVFPAELVRMLDRLEDEIRQNAVSEESWAWLAGCGLTVEQMAAQMEEAPEPQRKIHLYHCDHRGLPLALVDTDTRVAWSAGYDEWGNMLREENPQGLEQLIRLPGQQYDEESGLYYNRNRYYNPGLGRYITQDPIGLEGGWNLYQYPLDPLINIDPLGLDQSLFSNADEAGLFAIKMCNSDSITNNLEYGGLICKKDKNYFYTGPLKGNLAGVNPYNAACPSDSKRVGVYHTHGYFSDTKGNFVLKKDDAYDSLHFSPQDKSSADYFSKGEKEYSSYLGTPENTYFKYSPKTQKVSEMK